MITPFKIQIPKAEKKIKETYTDDELDKLLQKPNMKVCSFTEYKTFTDETEEERARQEENERLHEQTPEAARKIIHTLQRKIFYLYMFLTEQGFTGEPDEYLKEHMDQPAPFEEDW